MDATAFLNDFYSLTGITLKSRRSNLYTLLRKYKSAPPETKSTIIASLAPRTHLERIYRVDILIYFQRADELFSEFQNGDDIVVSKIIKHEWFFEQIFNKFTPNEFVNTVLPTVSYSARMKILNRFKGLGDDDKNDEIFDLLVARYGIHKSVVWLSKCSLTKMREFMQEYPTKRLSSLALKSMYEKDIELVLLYYKQHSITSDDKKWIIADLIKNDYDLFPRFFYRYRMGKRNTRKFVKAQRDTILADPCKYFDHVNNQQLRRTLGADADIVVEKLMPLDLTPIHDSCFYLSMAWIMLMQYPKGLRLKVFDKVFEKLFKKKVADDLEVISTTFLKDFVFDLDLREKLAMVKFALTENLCWWRFYKPQTCLDGFLAKLPKMDMRRRSDYLQIVAKSCVNSKDSEVLLQVLELVATRFKNDDSSITLNFIYVLQQNWDLLTSDKHYKLIFQCIANHGRLQESYQFDFVFKYWKFLYRQNRFDLVAQLIEHPQSLIKMTSRHFDDEPKLLRYILMFVLEHQDKVPKASFEYKEDRAGNKMTQFEWKIICNCTGYIKKNPSDRFNRFDYEELRSYYDHYLIDDFDFTHFESLVLYEEKSDQLVDYFDRYIEKNGAKLGIWRCLLEKYPEIVAKHLSKLLESMTAYRLDSIDWNLLRCFSHLGIDKEITNLCLTQLKSEACKSPENYIKPLAYSMIPEDFKAFIQQYIPIYAKVDLKIEEQKRNYHIQMKILESLTHFDLPSNALPIIMQFCKGDFLKYALQPLYSNMYRLREDKTKEYIDKFNSTKAVSVRKHGLLLSLELNDLRNNLVQLQQQSEVPTLSPTIKLFRNNPSAEIWQIFKAKLEGLKADDEPYFDYILRQKIPPKFFGEYFATMWQMFDRTGINKYRNTMLGKLDAKLINHVDIEFIKELINGKVFKTPKIDYLVVLLLIYTQDHTGWYEEFLTELEDLKTCTKKWFSKVSGFVSMFEVEYVKQSVEANVELIEKLSADLTQIFEIEEIFHEYLTLELLKQKGETMENMSENLLAFQLDLTRKYGETIIGKYHLKVVELVIDDYFEQSTEKRIDFALQLLQRCQNKCDYLLVIRVLPTTRPNDAKIGDKYDQIVETLKSVKDYSVKIHLYCYLKECY